MELFFLQFSSNRVIFSFNRSLSSHGGWREERGMEVPPCPFRPKLDGRMDRSRRKKADRHTIFSLLIYSSTTLGGHGGTHTSVPPLLLKAI